MNLWKTDNPIGQMINRLIPFHSLRWRLMASFLLVSLLPLLVVGVMAIIQSINSSERATYSNLEAVRNLKAKQVTTYFETVQQDLQLVAGLDLVRDSYRQIGQAYTSTDPEVLRSAGFLGHSELTEAPVFSTYNLPHKKYHDFFAEIATVRNYTDILLVSRDGDVVYSYAKNDDFATNLKTGPYSDTALGRLLAEIVADPVPGKIHITDYEPYSPADGLPVSFVGAPLADGSRGATGILIYEISVDPVASLMLDDSGTTTSDETYLVGQDKKMRTRSLSDSAEQIVVDTAAVEKGLQGESGVLTIVNYSGEYVISAYQPVKVQEQNWVLLTEVNEDRAFAQSTRLLYLIVGLIALTGVLVAWAGYFLTNSFVHPILGLTKAANALSAGQLEQKVIINRQDELGVLAKAFNTMAGQLHETVSKLEDRVTERTRSLEIVASLGEKLSAILNPEDLLTEVVTQLQTNFGYYHTHIYLINEQRDKLMVAAGTGAAGMEMKQKGHSITVNAYTSLVARAARTARIIRVGNVRETGGWLPNPLLPNTYSEIAVPIISAVNNQVIGVLDVQEDKLNGFDEADETMLRTLANQVSVAIHNARLFEDVQTSLAEARKVQARYLKDIWHSSSLRSTSREYLYVKPGAQPVDEEKQKTITGLKQLAAEKERPTPVTLTGADFEAVSLVAPVKVKDQLIGTLQLHSLDKDRVWTEEDIAMIATVLDQLAQAAENLRLFDETRERAGYERTIREITTRLRAATSVEQLLSIATHELGQHLSATHAELELGFEK